MNSYWITLGSTMGNCMRREVMNGEVECLKTPRPPRPWPCSFARRSGFRWTAAYRRCCAVLRSMVPRKNENKRKRCGPCVIRTLEFLFWFRVFNGIILVMTFLIIGTWSNIVLFYLGHAQWTSPTPETAWKGKSRTRYSFGTSSAWQVRRERVWPSPWPVTVGQR